MAASEKSGGTVLTDGTEQTLIDTADAGTYQFVLDYDALQAGDVVEIRTYTKARSGGTSRQIGPTLSFGGIEYGSRLYVSPAILAPFQYKVTIDRVAGTDRTLTWSVHQP